MWFCFCHNPKTSHGVDEVKLQVSPKNIEEWEIAQLPIAPPIPNVQSNSQRLLAIPKYPIVIFS